MTKEVIDKKRERFIISAIVVVIAIIAGLMSIYKFPLKLENMAEDSLYQNAGAWRSFASIWSNTKNLQTSLPHSLSVSPTALQVI